MFDLHFIVTTGNNKNNNNTKIMSICTELFINLQSPDWLDSEKDISKFCKKKNNWKDVAPLYWS